MAAAATSTVVVAEDITEGVMLSTVAGAASLADFPEVVAADATSLANAAWSLRRWLFRPLLERRPWPMLG